MKGIIRVVLVDPNGESRQALQRLLGGISSVWLAEVCTSYEAASKSVAENSPDLTLVVIDSDPEQAVGLIQALVRGKAGAVVLPASKERDSEVILRVIRAGAREFLPLPADLDELLGALDRLIRPDNDARSSARRGSQVIAITGAAGGIGCTTLAVNLAVTLAKEKGRSVVLADFDLLLGSVDTCLDIIPDHTLVEVARDVDRLDLTLLKRSLTRHDSGLFVLPRPVAMEDIDKIDPDSIRRVIAMLKAAFDTVIIDASKGLSGADYAAFDMADTILLVVQLELTSLRNSARLLHYFRQHEGMAERVRVVVNRVGANACEIGLKKAEETLKLPVSWQIPNTYKIFSAARAKGTTLDVEAPGSRAHRAIREIAIALTAPPAADLASLPKRRPGRFAALFL